MKHLLATRHCLFKSLVAFLGIVASQLWLSGAVHAISIRDDVDVSQYNLLADQFPVSGYLATEGSDFAFCSCTLVAPTKVLTAAHCVDTDGNGPDDIWLNGSIYFGLGPNVNPSVLVSGGGGPREGEFVDAEEGVGEIVTGSASRPDNIASLTGPTRLVTSYVIHPEWEGFPFAFNDDASHDLAVLTIESGIPAVTPARVTGLDPSGLTAQMVGYGNQGTGVTGANNGTDVPGANDRLAAENVLDEVDLVGGLIRADFDSPTTDVSVIGDATPLPLEGIPAQGDSGGAIYVDFGGTSYVVGVVSFGSGTPVGEYGWLVRWAAVGSPSNAAFLLSQGIGVVADTNSDFDVDSSDLTTLFQNFTGDIGAAGLKTLEQGDVDGDGDVDTADLTTAFQLYTGPLSIIGNNPDGGEDIFPGGGSTGDSSSTPIEGAVALSGASTPSMAVPEPSSFVLVLLGGIAVFIGRLRTSKR